MDFGKFSGLSHLFEKFELDAFRGIVRSTDKSESNRRLTLLATKRSTHDLLRRLVAQDVSVHPLCEDHLFEIDEVHI